MLRVNRINGFISYDLHSVSFCNGEGKKEVFYEFVVDWIFRVVALYLGR